MSYMNLIQPTNFSSQGAKQNLNNIKQYNNILNNKPSTKLAAGINIEKPLGRVFLRDTSSNCLSMDTQTLVPRYSIMDFRKSSGFVNSAVADFNTAANTNVFGSSDISMSNYCIKATIMETNENGITNENTQYVVLADISAADPAIFKNGIKPSPPTTKKEAFANMAVQSVDSDLKILPDYMKNMDVGQKIFVGSTAILGLYMYFKLLYGRK